MNGRENKTKRENPMNGYDIQQYENLKIRADQNKMAVYTYGERIGLKSSRNGAHLGFFESVHAAFCFIYGYELGVMCEFSKQEDEK